MIEMRKTTLGEVVEIFDHKRVPLSSAQRASRQGTYPYYGAQGIIDYIDDFIFDGRFILIPEDGENLRSRKLPIAYFAEGRFWVNNHAHIVKAKPGVANDRFVQSALETSDISAFVTGTAQPKLSQANLRRIPILLPSLADQAVIAEILDELDDLIENNQRRIELLEQMTQAIYREWFVRFCYPDHKYANLVDSPLGPIPEGWKVLAASELLAVNPRVSINKTVEHPFVTMGDLNERSMICVPSGTRASGSGSKFQNGDTLFARITPCLENGKTGLVQFLPRDEIGLGSTEFIVLRGRLVGPAFTYFLAREDEFRASAIQSMIGASGRQRVRNECFDSFLVATPPAALAQQFEQSSEPALTMAYSLARENRALQTLRHRLIPKLVTGQIDVSELDFNVEGVSVA